MLSPPYQERSTSYTIMKMEPYGNVSASTSYSSLPSIAPQQLQHQNALPAHTLPPLQPQQSAFSMQPMYGNPLTAPHTPSTSAPNTPGSAGNGAFQQQMGGQPQHPRGYSLSGNPYQQSAQAFHQGSPMMPQTSSSMPQPKSIAPAPSSRLVPIQPMTNASNMNNQHNMNAHMQGGMNSPYGQQGIPNDNDTPTHVVGSQGRRGILPSAPGRPAVTATGNGSAKNTVIPTKDADGKFPCPHCTKTYLHAKHLKRHLLRHTGDRPYMCILCRDTFSRSDILKRHFQKCSIRRGNPTGASHLSHAQAHLKKPQMGQQKGSIDMDNMRTMGGLNSNSGDQGGNHVFGVIPMPDTASSTPGEESAQDQLSRSNSIKRLSNAGAGPRDRRSVNGQSLPPSSRQSFDNSYTNSVSTTMASGIQNQLAAAFNSQNGFPIQSYDYPQHNNGAGMHAQVNGDMSGMASNRGMMYGGSMNGQQPSNEWSQPFFAPGTREGFSSSSNLGSNHH